MLSAVNPRLTLNLGGINKPLSGSLQRRRYRYRVYDHGIGSYITRSRNTNEPEFRYTVAKGDRETSGVGIAADNTFTLGLDCHPATATPDQDDKEDNEDSVILSLRTLTFTITDDDARGVTGGTDVRACGGGSDDGKICGRRVGREETDGGYADADEDTAMFTFTLVVKGAGGILPQEGTYTVNGRQVTMTPGTLAGMRLTLPATLMETDGDAVPLTFSLVAVPAEPVRVTVTDATGHVTLAVRTLDDRRVEPTATF